MNKTEEAVKQSLESNGWRVYKSGFPDFMAFKEGRVRFVEVKALGDTVRPEQSAVVEELKKCKLLCDIVYPQVMAEKIWIKNGQKQRTSALRTQRYRERKKKELEELKHKVEALWG